MSADLRELAKKLGGEVSGGQVLCPGPGHSAKDRSLSIRPCSSSSDELLVYSFANDDWRDCRDHVRRLLGLQRPAFSPSPAKYTNKVPQPPSADRIRDLKSAARIVSQIRTLLETPGERSLPEVRKIHTDAIADVLSRTDAIGWHPSVYFNQPDPAKEHHELHGQRFGAIIAILTDPITAKPTGAISRTYLRPDLTKIGKAKTLGGPVGIMRLSLDEEVLGGLHLVEGLENGLYAMAKGFRPVWAVGSTSQMAAFPLLSGVECLNIFADRDEKEGGERAAKEAACRWRAAGRETHILRLKQGLGDLNDVALRGWE